MNFTNYFPMCMQLQYTVRAEFETSFKRWIIELIQMLCASFISPWSLLRKFELRQHESVQKLTAVLQKQTSPTRLTNTNNRLSMVELLMHDPLPWQWVWSSMMHRCVVESRLGLFSRRNTTSASAPARECVTQYESICAQGWSLKSKPSHPAH